jgi:hypothetical protein
MTSRSPSLLEIAGCDGGSAEVLKGGPAPKSPLLFPLAFSSSSAKTYCGRVFISRAFKVCLLFVLVTPKSLSILVLGLGLKSMAIPVGKDQQEQGEGKVSKCLVQKNDPLKVSDEIQIEDAATDQQEEVSVAPRSPTRGVSQCLCSDSKLISAVPPA